MNCNGHKRWHILEACVNACWVYTVGSVSGIYLVLSVTFFIFFAMCGVACVKPALSSLGDREDVFVTDLIFVIKSKVSTFTIVVIFSCGWVPVVVVSLFTVGFIYIPAKLTFSSTTV